MNKVAVVKADHIGDFVLSVPAFRALLARFGGFDLFASPTNLFLKGFFLDQRVTFRPVKLAYLQKGDDGVHLNEFIGSIGEYSLVIFLRDDEFSARACEMLGDRCVKLCGDNDIHETSIQKNTVEKMCGPYSRSRLFWGQKAPVWPKRIHSVGISLGAGFIANKMPVVTWVQFANKLQRRGINVKLIGGPLERDELALLAKLLRIGDSDIVVGGHDLRAFYKQVSCCDVVIGADSGSLHLVSAAVPVLGVYTASPWKRFAPFGSENRVIYSNVSCSPCIQFSKHAFNGCLSRECAARIGPDELETGLLYDGREADIELGGPKLIIGASHLPVCERS